LRCGETFREQQINLIVQAEDCPIQVNQTLNQTPKNCSNTLLINGSEGVLSICVDNLTDICTNEEILKGDWRGCFTRYTTNLAKSEQTCKQELSDCKSELEKWDLFEKQREKYTQESMAIIKTILMIIAGAAITGAGLYFYRRYERRPTGKIIPKTELKQQLEQQTKTGKIEGETK